MVINGDAMMMKNAVTPRPMATFPNTLDATGNFFLISCETMRETKINFQSCSETESQEYLFPWHPLINNTLCIAGESTCGGVSGNCDSGSVAGEEGCKFDGCEVSWLTVTESCISASCEFKVTTEEENGESCRCLIYRDVYCLDLEGGRGLETRVVVGRDGTGRNGTGRDGTGPGTGDGTGRGTGRDGTERGTGNHLYKTVLESSD
uniref:Uncharacterized protein n=1 Tax=Populus trichocarpa TaxID=3694 RepID=A0A2K2AR39_POPTR